MHEYAVTKSILQIVLEKANKVHATKVLEIKLVIGELSSFAEESVRMYFEILSKDTPAQNAKIVVKNIPADFYCKTCDSVFLVDSTDFKCPKCAQTGIYNGSGKDFYVESIEVE